MKPRQRYLQRDGRYSHNSWVIADQATERFGFTEIQNCGKLNFIQDQQGGFLHQSLLYSGRPTVFHAENKMMWYRKTQSQWQSTKLTRCSTSWQQHGDLRLCRICFRSAEIRKIFRTPMHTKRTQLVMAFSQTVTELAGSERKCKIGIAIEIGGAK